MPVRTFVIGGTQFGCMSHFRYVPMTENPRATCNAEPMRIKGIALDLFIAMMF